MIVMELRQLKYFVEVGRLKSYSQASKTLFITQSTISQQIRKLEEELGVELLTRDTRHVALSDYGEQFYPCAVQILEEARAGAERIRDVKALKVGTISIGATYSFGPLLKQTVLDFYKKYPHIRLNLVITSKEDLQQKLFEADCVFITDSDCFERATKDWSKDFVKRQEIFGQRSFLDAIDDTMVRSLSMVEGVDRNEAILAYLSCQGRLLCCTAKTKRMMSQKFNSHLHSLRKNGKAFCGSFAISSEPMPLMETAFYLGVAPYDSEEDALEYCARAYGRTLAVLRDHGLDKTTDEVLVLFVQSETHQVFCLLRRVGSMDYSFAPDEEIVSQEMYSQAKQKMNLSEWDVVHGRRDV